MWFSLLISIIQLYVVPNSCKSLLFLIRICSSDAGCGFLFSVLFWLLKFIKSINIMIFNLVVII